MGACDLPHDIFAEEVWALQDSRRACDRFHALSDAEQRAALEGLLASFERLLRETRRLVDRSDRAEREMNDLNQRLKSLAIELQYRATHDPLTRVLNRAAVIDAVNTVLRTDALALVVLDIDHFKRINDQFGHPAGDRVIVGVVDRLRAHLPPFASVGRVGGEEFTVLLPSTSAAAAAALAETMRRAIALHAFELPDGSAVTASFGVSWTAAGGTFDEAYHRADDALYSAKRSGRDRIVAADANA